MKRSLNKIKLLATMAVVVYAPVTGMAQSGKTQAQPPKPKLIAPTSSGDKLAMAAKVKGAADNTLTAAEKKAGYTLLFDGKSMDQLRGFRKETVTDSWKVEDSAITLVSGGGGELITKH